MQTPRTWSCKLAKVSSLLKQQIFIDFVINLRTVVFAQKWIIYCISLKLLSKVALLATLFVPKYQRSRQAVTSSMSSVHTVIDAPVNFDTKKLGTETFL